MNEHITPTEDLLDLPKEFLIMIIQTQQEHLNRAVDELTHLAGRKREEARSWRAYIKRSASTPD